MPPEILWNVGLTAILALVGWVLKSHADEVKRLQILLNRTREEMANEAEWLAKIAEIKARYPYPAE